MLLLTLWTKVKGWVIGLLAVLGAVAGAFLLGRFKGASAQKEEDQQKEEERVEKEKEVVQQIDKKNADLRISVEEKINALPVPQVPKDDVADQGKSPAQVAVRPVDADPDSAAGRLSQWATKRSGPN